MARLGGAVAREIRRHRLAQGMSAQQLADACEKIGAPIARTVISNIENGRRTNVSVAEVLVFARALGVPPAALVFPAGYEPSVEYLPNKVADPLAAIDWWSGEQLAPDDRSLSLRTFPPDAAQTPARWALYLMRKHRELLNRIRDLRKGAWETSIIDMQNGVTDSHEAAVAREVAVQLEYRLFDLREELRARGLVVPELPGGMTLKARPEEHWEESDGEITGRWTTHGTPPL
ncbi:helix-turn-helix transcriptional regulator [Streptomyces sp. NPDC001876]|uniref:helix-turn-helix domain-containing protein n=1 Tax=Streptomyces sp. NPDC001876 TaxID=3154402 RepID=UPI003320BA0A